VNGQPNRPGLSVNRTFGRPVPICWNGQIGADRNRVLLATELFAQLLNPVFSAAVTTTG
jgi:hypothetical protein